MNDALTKAQEEIREHGREIQKRTAKHWSTEMFGNVIWMRACVTTLFGDDKEMMDRMDRTVEQIRDLCVRAMVNDWKDPEEDK